MPPKAGKRKIGGVSRPVPRPTQIGQRPLITQSHRRKVWNNSLYNILYESVGIAIRNGHILRLWARVRRDPRYHTIIGQFTPSELKTHYNQMIQWEKIHKGDFFKNWLVPVLKPTNALDATKYRTRDIPQSETPITISGPVLPPLYGPYYGACDSDDEYDDRISATTKTDPTNITTDNNNNSDTMSDSTTQQSMPQIMEHQNQQHTHNNNNNNGNNNNSTESQFKPPQYRVFNDQYIKQCTIDTLQLKLHSKEYLTKLMEIKIENNIYDSIDIDTYNILPLSLSLPIEYVIIPSTGEPSTLEVIDTIYNTYQDEYNIMYKYISYYYKHRNDIIPLMMDEQRQIALEDIMLSPSSISSSISSSQHDVNSINTTTAIPTNDIANYKLKSIKTYLNNIMGIPLWRTYALLYYISTSISSSSPSIINSVLSYEYYKHFNKITSTDIVHNTLLRHNNNNNNHIYNNNTCIDIHSIASMRYHNMTFGGGRYLDK